MRLGHYSRFTLAFVSAQQLRWIIMTMAGRLLRAVRELNRSGQSTVTRAEVFEELGVTTRAEKDSYSAIFQGMRVDHPGGAPEVDAAYSDTLKRVSRGQYVLTTKGAYFFKD